MTLNINPFMEELPADLMIDILSRLPVKTIIHCKCVCKKWRNLVLHSYFVNLHLSRSPTCLIIHHNPVSTTDDPWYYPKDPGILKLFEIEDKVDHHRLHHHPLMTLDLKLAPILQNCKIDQVGSVNGLICLRQKFPKFDNIYICNPITREYMKLPRCPNYTHSYGFGVSSGEYKVVRTSYVDITSNGYRSFEASVLEAEVYTLGTGQWRSIGRVPYRLDEFYAPLLNGHCHWIVDDEEDAPEKLCSFDLHKETFQLFPSPPSKGIQVSWLESQSLGVLKGCLCQLDDFEDGVTLWVMKEYGIKESWHKKLVITHEIKRRLNWPRWHTMPLIEGLKDGSVLAVSDDKLWAFYPQTEKIEVIGRFKCFRRGLAYRPSFLKLQNFESERVQMFHRSTETVAYFNETLDLFS